MIWTVVVIFVPLVGSLSWLLIGRRSANKERDAARVPHDALI
ncbi:hypothetical protein FM104_06040 [Microbacterium esteraromaticum]|uniref:Cardiolipin synthase N-terminal domain-containing protein n=1 Tax=Microbacterium esteraromaticum TaxID=57043 RepID=A0A1R4J8S4_9MICO|nr:hypothetical protein FM104_06040 [Microbacterium esteraromaticum]